jgi:anti-anti-sigma factor
MTTYLNGMPAAPVSLLLDQAQKANASVFACRGSFTLATHVQLDRLVEMIRRDSAPRIVLDLREVQHMDSVGVGTLAMILKNVLGTSRLLVLVCSPAVRELLAASSLDVAFTFAATLDAALP